MQLYESEGELGTTTSNTGKIHLLSGDVEERTFCGIKAPWHPSEPMTGSQLLNIWTDDHSSVCYSCLYRAGLV